MQRLHFLPSNSAIHTTLTAMNRAWADQNQPASISLARSASKPSTNVLLASQRKVGLGRLLKFGRKTKTDSKGDASSACKTGTKEKQPTGLRSCLKKTTGNMTSLSLHPEYSKIKKRSSPSSRSQKPKVHFDFSNKALAPPSSSDYRNPKLWWNSEDLQRRRLLDLNTMKTDIEAHAYLHQCLQTRSLKCLKYTAAIESSSSPPPNQQSFSSALCDLEQRCAAIKLQRVFVEDLQSGYMQGFRGLESAFGGSAIARKRSESIQSVIHEVIMVQQNCGMYMQAPALAVHMANIAAQQSLHDRCWARLLAIGDELSLARELVHVGACDV